MLSLGTRIFPQWALRVPVLCSGGGLPRSPRLFTLLECTAQRKAPAEMPEAMDSCPATFLNYIAQITFLSTSVSVSYTCASSPYV